MSNFMKLFLSCVLGVTHYVAAFLLDFYGAVLNPSWLQQQFSLLSFLLMMPFILLLYAPTFQSSLIGILIGLLNLIFWIWIYYLLINKVIR